MSEFQYYEFYSVDKELTTKERKEVDALSSRFSPTSRRAIFTYSYSDFRHDEETVLLKYFDFFLYISNWGTKRLMYKLPEKLVDYPALKAYVSDVDVGYYDSGLRVYKKAGYVIIDLSLSEEEGEGYWIEEEAQESADLIRIREDILGGDYRGLFIMWLHTIQLRHQFDDLDASFEIPLELVPDNLGKRNGRFDSLTNLFEIDTDWIDAIATYSNNSSQPEADYAKLIRQLPAAKKDKLLLKVFQGEPNVKVLIKKQLDKLTDTTKKSKQGSVSLEILLQSVERASKKREESYLAEQERERLARLKATEQNKSALLQQLTEHIEKGLGKSYQHAIEIILELQRLAVHQGETKQFEEWIKTVKEMSAKKPAMLKRLKENKL